MGEQPAPLTGPDLTTGVATSELDDGAMLLGHAHGEPVLLTRVGDEFFAVGALCTHYGGPLAEGILVGDTVRCPWHHACFSLRTGDAVRAPALRPLARWNVEHRNGTVFVTRKIEPRDPELGEPSLGPSHTRKHPTSVIIVGAGAAGSAAAETLRREGFTGAITLIDGDPDAPYDRPNLSKDYLAGNAPEEWIPLRAPEFYRERGIDLLRDQRVARLAPDIKRVILEDGSTRAYDALVIATGAEPVRLPAAVATAQRVYYLRTLADSRAIIAGAEHSRTAVVLGASFIGLEVAASLRTRGLEVHVVAPEIRPLERVMGPQLGDFIRGVHEAHGVIFHMERTASAIENDFVTLSGGERLRADIVVAGIGVRLNTALAADAGLASANGVQVNEYLETSAPGIFAAGDIAYWPDPHTGERIHVEHWVVAQRQGQTAARNILGARERFDAVPFFWSRHYDVSISYVGHAERWDEMDLTGNVAAGNCAVTFRRAGRPLAIATVGRDRASLEAEASMEGSLKPTSVGSA